VLLAAGKSSRFGGNKLLHPLADGTPLCVAAARNLTKVLDEVVAVVADESSRVARLLRLEGLQVTVNGRAEEGMGTSLACGIAAASAPQWLVALADMPFIQPLTVTRIARELRLGRRLVAPSHQGRRGHPVGFGAGFREDLLALRGDQGAQQLLERHRHELCLVAVDDAGVRLDIDTTQDLSRLGPTRVRP
jgi:molybdenum cofactor cytidylyltransferase